MFRDVRQILSIFIIDLWFQGHSGSLKSHCHQHTKSYQYAIYNHATSILAIYSHDTSQDELSEA